MRERTSVLTENFFESDTSFNALYPLNMRMLADRHWTNINVVKLAVDFLGSAGGKILDIGSGVGKFCLAGARYAPNAQFIGIEQREYLVRYAQYAQKKLDVQNVSFIRGNFTQLDLQEFDHFYFFNSFYENLDDLDRIDEDIDYSEALYEYYVRYLYNGLQQMPKGTKLVTYHSLHREVPRGYEIVESHQNNDLVFWIKK